MLTRVHLCDTGCDSCSGVASCAVWGRHFGVQYGALSGIQQVYGLGFRVSSLENVRQAVRRVSPEESPLPTSLKYTIELFASCLYLLHHQARRTSPLTSLHLENT